jgi:6-phosphogluconolactonase (cycloisomerase 2 family)
MSIKMDKAALILALVFVFNLAVPLAAQINQMNRIAYFRNVPISIDLQFKKSALSKGVYDLEFMRVPNTKAYYLRIKKKGKILHVVQGENYPYTKITEMSNAPRLHMNRDTATNMFIIVVESGAYSKPYSKIRAKYCMACVEKEPTEPVTEDE